MSCVLLVDSQLNPMQPLEQTPQYRGVRISEAASSERGLAECLKGLLEGPELRHDITRASFNFGVSRLDSGGAMALVVFLNLKLL